MRPQARLSATTFPPGPQASSLQQNPTPSSSSSVSLILGNSSATTYCLRTPSSLLLLLAKLTGSTGSFPLLARTEHAENASLAENAPLAEPKENAAAEPAESVFRD